MCCNEIPHTPIDKVTAEDILNNLPVAVLQSPLAALVPEGFTVLENGDIVASAEHPGISGYVRDEQNPALFHSQWPACDYRMQGVKGSKHIDVVMVCNCPDVPTFMKTVQVDHCRNCPKKKDQ